MTVVIPNERTIPAPRLMIAAWRGDEYLVRMYLERGDDVNATNGKGVTALAWAAKKNQVRIARMLLAHGADLDRPDQDGDTPLMRAVIDGRLDTCCLLAEMGASLVEPMQKARELQYDAIYDVLRSHAMQRALRDVEAPVVRRTRRIL